MPTRATHPLTKILLIAAISLLAAAPAALAAAPVSVGTVGPNVLVRPADSPSVNSGTTTLLAARNEFESLQIVVRAPSGAPVTGLDVDVVGQLAHPNGTTLPASAITTYRVGYYTATGYASDMELGGALGAFPDMLIPRRDAFWGEARAAFPIDVPSAENRLAWIDVLVPPTAPAGTYSGASIRVASTGNAPTLLPLRVTVLDTTIPSTTSLLGGFDLNTNQLCRAGAHDCGSFPGGAAAVTAMYETVALDNRMTIAKPPASMPSWPANATYRTHTRPLIMGSANTRLAGARLQTVTIYQWATESADEWRRHAEADGFLSRVRFHCDEIGSTASLWRTCRDDWTRANTLWRGAAAPGTASDLPLQVTTSMANLQWGRGNGFADLADRVTTLIPVVNHLHPKSAPAFPGLRSSYDAWLGAPTAGGMPRELWTYTSCMSMGCTPAGTDTGELWNGWPSYGVDQPAAQARATSWVAYAYDVKGEYYYETALDLPTAWTSLWSADGGNHGDGTLFYPGTVARIGGVHDVALESIRMKRIRDGREDYELLRLAGQVAGRAEAVRIARSAFPSAFQTSATQASIDAARVELGALVAGHVPEPEPEVEPDRGTRGDEGTGGGTGSTDEPPKTGSPGATQEGDDGTKRGILRTPTIRHTCNGRRATIVGTNRGEVIRGTRGVDVIVALGGNDTIYGFGGADIICAGSGNDRIITSGDRRARDIVICGAGRDVVTHDRRDSLRGDCERRVRRG